METDRAGFASGATGGPWEPAGHVRHHQLWLFQRDCRLIPYIPSVPREVSALERLLHSFCIANGASSRVDEPRSFFHLADELLVEETMGLLVQRAVLSPQSDAGFGKLKTKSSRTTVTTSH